jgi:hypothetical protein
LPEASILLDISITGILDIVNATIKGPHGGKSIGLWLAAGRQTLDLFQKNRSRTQETLPEESGASSLMRSSLSAPIRWIVMLRRSC